MKGVREQMEQDEQLSVLMSGLRGSNVDESDFAASDVSMRVVEVSAASGADGDSLPLVYDPKRIDEYWLRRPGAVAQRAAQLVSIAGGFLARTALDAVRGKLKENEVERAIDLRNIVTSLGPAYIKLGQALAIRPDILSPAAMVEMQRLCDKVPSFDNETAFTLLEQELGGPWQQFYAELGPDPIAAASLGQVYKGKLLSGETVAVKVQRPFVLETVTVDLFVIRRLGLLLRNVEGINTDVVALLDEWATAFFDELDYVKEGNNATKFAEQMAVDLPQIVVPKTYDELTSRRVLTSEWLEGEKLSQSTADDVGDLVAIGVICFLKQLLDTGFFHADPHPGNLIRTPDGQLAILDFGLMTQIDDDIKFGMVEAIAHLIHRDYEAIVQDFVTLQFIPEGTNLQPILPVLARVFDQALEGGGAKNINFQDLAGDLAQITFDYPFRIPSFFALIIRAIGVLEGIALVGDPEFALVDEAYPYISKRLLTDESPRLQAALRYMVYGKRNVFDADRLIDLLEASEQFQVVSNTTRASAIVQPGRNGFGAGAGAAAPAPQPSPTDLFAALGLPQPGALPPPPRELEELLQPALAAMEAQQPALFAAALPTVGGSVGGGGGGTSDDQAREALKFVLSPEGALFRGFLLDELVKGIDALTRVNAAQQVRNAGLDRLQVPVLLPGAVASVPLAPVVTDEDRLMVSNVEKLLTFLLGKDVQVSPETFNSLVAAAQEILPELSTRLSSRVTARFLRQVYSPTAALAA